MTQETFNRKCDVLSSITNCTIQLIDNSNLERSIKEDLGLKAVKLKNEILVQMSKLVVHEDQLSLL